MPEKTVQQMLEEFDPEKIAQDAYDKVMHNYVPFDPTDLLAGFDELIAKFEDKKNIVGTFIDQNGNKYAITAELIKAIH